MLIAHKQQAIGSGCRILLYPLLEFIAGHVDQRLDIRCHDLPLSHSAFFPLSDQIPDHGQ